MDFYSKKNPETIRSEVQTIRLFLVFMG